jgi:hypothetical protein
MSSSKSIPRLGFIDDARGVAVVLMIQWHIVEGWVRPELRASALFEILQYVGGLAAPLFIMLSGAVVALKFCGDRAKSRPVALRMKELVSRGLYVMSLGYALRLFMWMVDSKALLEPRYAPVWLLCGLGLAAMLVGFDRLSTTWRSSLFLVLLGISAYTAGLLLLWEIAPTEVFGLLKVDVLQAIGASLVIMALLEFGFGICRNPWIGLLLGLGVASITTYVESLSPTGIPVPLSAYIARFTDGSGRGVVMFPLLPLSGYGLIGVSLGVLWHRSSTGEGVTRAFFWLLCACIAVEMVIKMFPILIAYTPSITRMTRLLQKSGLALILVSSSYFLTQWAGRFPLRSIGKTSLLIYCVHLELVYGLCGRPWIAALSYEGCLMGFVVMMLLMVGLAHVRLYLQSQRVTKQA